MPRVSPSGSQVVKGSFVAAMVTADCGLFCLNRASPAGVIGGMVTRADIRGPIHAPFKSRFGAGPGGFGILGTPRRSRSDCHDHPAAHPVPGAWLRAELGPRRKRAPESLSK